MKNTLYCGIDLHSSNGVYVINDHQGKILFQKRLPNRLPIILEALNPYKKRLKTVAVESTYNWYWLVDGLMDQGFPMKLASPAAIDQYDGLKEANDLTDAAFIAELARLGILPTGYIYPQQQRPIRDMLRRRMLLVRQKTSLVLSLQNMFVREANTQLTWRKIRKLSVKQRNKILKDNVYLIQIAEEQIDLIEQLSEKIQQFEETVLSTTKLKPEFELLLTAPGIGEILGITIMLETGEISRFEQAGNYTSYCRCVRAKKTSNGKNKGKNNSKNGNRYLSWAFVEVAHHAIQTCPQAKKFYDRKKAKRNGALATKALAAKWCKGVYYVLKQQAPFDLKRIFPV
jgi:transposase